MNVNFVNSETVKINGKDMIYLRESLTILKQISETLERVGPDRFFSSPYEEEKRARESMATLFLMLAFQSQTKDFIFCMQPKNDPPDFMILKIGDELESLGLDPFELVEIPTRCITFQDMMKIVQKKIDKKYSESYNLLIFINNEKSKEWVTLLNSELKDYSPFKSIWTIHLLALGEDFWPIVNKLRPYPIQTIEAKLENIKLPKGVPALMEENIYEGERFISFKSEVITEFRNKVREIRLNNK